MKTDWDLSLPSLAETFKPYFLLGNIWCSVQNMWDPSIREMFKHHYNAITASNNHKPCNLLSGNPEKWVWDFKIADEIVDWAEENNIAMTGHTLLWHNMSRNWLTNIPGTTQPLTRQEAMENLHRYISTVAGRYSGRMYSWDVINEALNPTDWVAEPDWRKHLRRTGEGYGLSGNADTRWYDAFANGAQGDECGSDYIYYAFKFARTYDPVAKLYYNDYNEFDPSKCEAIAQMVEQVNER